MDNSMFKMDKEHLIEYMNIMKKGSCHKKKKGAGSYTRKIKHKKSSLDF